MSTDGWIQEDGVRMHSGVLLSHYKRNETMPFAATWTSPEMIVLSEVSEKETTHTISLICGI